MLVQSASLWRTSSIWVSTQTSGILCIFFGKSSTNAAAFIVDEHAQAMTINALIENASGFVNLSQRGAGAKYGQMNTSFYLWNSTNRCWQTFCYRCVVGILKINASHGQTLVRLISAGDPDNIYTYCDHSKTSGLQPDHTAGFFIYFIKNDARNATRIAC